MSSLSRSGPFGSCQIHGSMPMPQSESDDLSNMPDIDNASGGIKSPILNNPAFSHSKCPTEIHRSCFCVRFIAEHTKLLEDSTKVSNFMYTQSPTRRVRCIKYLKLPAFISIHCGQSTYVFSIPQSTKKVA